eukprot:403369200
MGMNMNSGVVQMKLSQSTDIKFIKQPKNIDNINKNMIDLNDENDQGSLLQAQDQKDASQLISENAKIKVNIEQKKTGQFGLNKPSEISMMNVDFSPQNFQFNSQQKNSSNMQLPFFKQFSQRRLSQQFENIPFIQDTSQQDIIEQISASSNKKVANIKQDWQIQKNFRYTQQYFSSPQNQGDDQIKKENNLKNKRESPGQNIFRALNEMQRQDKVSQFNPNKTQTNTDFQHSFPTLLDQQSLLMRMKKDEPRQTQTYILSPKNSQAYSHNITDINNLQNALKTSKIHQSNFKPQTSHFQKKSFQINRHLSQNYNSPQNSNLNQYDGFGNLLQNTHDLRHHIDELKTNLKTQARRRKAQEKDLRSSQISFFQNASRLGDGSALNIQYYEKNQMESQNLIKQLRDVNEQVTLENQQLNLLNKKLIEEQEKRVSFDIFGQMNEDAGNQNDQSNHQLDSAGDRHEQSNNNIMSVTAKQKFKKAISELKNFYENELKNLSQSFSEEVEMLYQIISDQGFDNRNLNAKFQQLDYLYSNVKNDYEILIRGIKTELRNEAVNSERLQSIINHNLQIIDDLKLEIQQQAVFVESCKDLKTTYKEKSRKLKDIVKIYQKKYHDIDIKFMHEEIQRMTYLKDYAKSTIAELENTSLLQQADIKQLLDYIGFMIGSGFMAFKFDQNDIDEIDEGPTLLSMLQSQTSVVYVNSKKNMFKAKRASQHQNIDGNPNNNYNNNLQLSDRDSNQSIQVSQRGFSSQQKIRKQNGSDLQVNLEDPGGFSELSQIDYDNDRSRFREDFENYIMKKGQLRF